ncbi:hypothetical protein LXL04_035683 [Taraxacum kok-saghyz]
MNSADQNDVVLSLLFPLLRRLVFLFSSRGCILRRLCFITKEQSSLINQRLRTLFSSLTASPPQNKDRVPDRAGRIREASWSTVASGRSVESPS